MRLAIARKRSSEPYSSPSLTLAMSWLRYSCAMPNTSLFCCTSTKSNMASLSRLSKMATSPICPLLWRQVLHRKIKKRSYAFITISSSPTCFCVKHKTSASHCLFAKYEYFSRVAPVLSVFNACTWEKSNPVYLGSNTFYFASRWNISMRKASKPFSRAVWLFLLNVEKCLKNEDRICTVSIPPRPARDLSCQRTSSTDSRGFYV